MFYERLHILALNLRNDDTYKDPDEKSGLVFGGPISRSDILIPTASRTSLRLTSLSSLSAMTMVAEARCCLHNLVLVLLVFIFTLCVTDGLF